MIRSRPKARWKAVLAALVLAAAGENAMAQDTPQVRYETQEVDGTTIFYRAAGPADAPVLLMLHGFPTSSHMYRDIIPLLARDYRVIAPDYPGYGFSDAPPADTFAYTFDHLAEIMGGFTKALGLDRYALYLQDFGGPVGFRLASRHPERVTGIVVQNAVAHEEGLSDAGFAPARAYWADRTPETEAPMRKLLTRKTTKFQFVHGAKDPGRISPDSWNHAQSRLDRPGNADIQLELLYNYRTNLTQYPVWQAYFREHRPPMLVVWGKNDPFFTVAGAEAYKRDLPDAEVHILDAGHFAIEENPSRIAELVAGFLARRKGG